MWLTKDIKYKRTKIYKETFFGKQIKNGFELLAPLEYKHGEDIMYLSREYVFDGPSFPKQLEWLVGKRNLKCLLAASAFHDTADNISVIRKSKDFGYYHSVSLDIRKAAWLYRKMIRDWPDAKVGKFQSQLQYIGLIIFHWFYRKITGGKVWKKYK